jgi:hypothetical protein
MRTTRAAHIALCKRISSGEATARELISWWAAMQNDEVFYRAAPLVVQAYEEGIVPIGLTYEIGGWTTAKYVVVQGTASGLFLPPNDIWNPPADVHEVRGDMKTTGYGWNQLTGYAALAVSGDRVFGWRQLSHPKESGYSLEGYVAIGGRVYSAFTSHQTFSRELSDKWNYAAIVDVATLHVRFPRWPRSRTLPLPLPVIPADMPMSYFTLAQHAAAAGSLPTPLPMTRIRYGYLFDE